VWISFAPECRLILAAFVGPRTFDSALQLKLQMTAAGGLGVPCFFSDGFSCDLSALIEVYHTLKTFPRTGKPGRPRKPVKEPQPDLVYGQVIKKSAKGVCKSWSLACAAWPSGWRSWGCRSVPVGLSVSAFPCVMPWRLWFAKTGVSVRITPRCGFQVHRPDAQASATKPLKDQCRSLIERQDGNPSIVVRCCSSRP
jgi:hypothetical protein